MFLFLKYHLFNYNFIFNNFFLFMINSSEKYFKNNLIFYLRLEKLIDAK